MELGKWDIDLHISFTKVMISMVHSDRKMEYCVTMTVERKQRLLSMDLGVHNHGSSCTN